jgi:hypothetical protein
VAAWGQNFCGEGGCEEGTIAGCVAAQGGRHAGRTAAGRAPLWGGWSRGVRGADRMATGRVPRGGRTTTGRASPRGGQLHGEASRGEDSRGEGGWLRARP